MTKKMGRTVFSRKVYSVSYGDSESERVNTVSKVRATVIAEDALTAIAIAEGFVKPSDDMFVWDVVCLSRDRTIHGGLGIGPVDGALEY